MKKHLILFAAGVLATAGAFAQDLAEKDVPSVVLNAFKKDFQKAADVEWEMKNSNYEVDFEVGAADHEVWYDASGKILRHKEDIGASDLPAAISTSIKKNFDGYRDSDFKRITTGGEVTYRVDLEKGADDLEVIFAASGDILSKAND